MVRLSLVVVLVSLSWGELAVAQGRPPIIDMHLHAQNLWAEPGIDAGTVFGDVFGSRHLGIPTALSTDRLREETLEALRTFNIVRAVVDGPNARRYWQASPDRVIIARAASPTMSTEALRAAFEAGEFQVLAEFAPQYSGRTPRDSSVMRILALAGELDIPVGIHMGLGPPGAAHLGSPNYRMAAGDPLLLEDALAEHPNLRLYVMHAGWPMADRMIALMHAYPGVHVDLAVLNWYLPEAEFYAYFERLVVAGFSKRIMFGTDQMQWPGAIGRAIERVESAPFLSMDQRRDVMCRNAARFLRIDISVCDE